jgi:hypothetical protein
MSLDLRRQHIQAISLTLVDFAVIQSVSAAIQRRT